MAQHKIKNFSIEQLVDLRGNKKTAYKCTTLCGITELVDTAPENDLLLLYPSNAQCLTCKELGKHHITVVYGVPMTSYLEEEHYLAHNVTDELGHPIADDMHTRHYKVK